MCVVTGSEAFQFPIAREVQWNLTATHTAVLESEFQFPIAREVQWNRQRHRRREWRRAVSVPYRSGSPVELAAAFSTRCLSSVSVPYRSGSPVEHLANKTARWCYLSFSSLSLGKSSGTTPKSSCYMCPHMFQFPIAREVQWNRARRPRRGQTAPVSVPYRSGSPVEPRGRRHRRLLRCVSVPYRSGSPVEPRGARQRVGRGGVSVPYRSGSPVEPGTAAPAWPDSTSFSSLSLGKSSGTARTAAPTAPTLCFSSLSLGKSSGTTRR